MAVGENISSGGATTVGTMRRGFLWTAPLVVVIVAAGCAGGDPHVSSERSDEVGGAPSATDASPGSSDPGPSDTAPADSGPADTSPAPGSTDPGTGRVERSSLDWTGCADRADLVVALECATLVVPLDHTAPDGPTIDISVGRVRATGSDPIGSLVFNPGGPGGSGVEILGFLATSMSPEITERFDLVSFDPRGVGVSTAIDCDIQIDDAVTLLAEGDDAGWNDLIDANAADLASCTTDALALAPYVGTNNAARDLDLLRAALGDETLSYVGYSYGTRLGATYAELFPERVRALVLDAAVKPTDDFAELDREQAGGFDRALEHFAAACDSDPDCVLGDVGPTLDVLTGLVGEIEEVGSFPTDDGDRRLLPGELKLGVASALYSKESWPFLAQALFVAEAQQDGSLLQSLGDLLVGRRPDGTYDNSQVANHFINCADDPARPTAEQQRTQAAESAADSTYFDDLLRASTGCLGVPAAIDPLIIGPATGAAPIVVIGNTGDPATPYEWSVELADSLDSAVLYTVEAEGHTAYGSIGCVAADIDAYLIDLVVPGDGAGCSDNADADFFLPPGESDVDQIFAFFDCVRDNGLDIPEFTEADLLADPTLETILGELDLGDPALFTSIAPCLDLIPGP
jgi:pimeloyl-ACP methyl ester carboxylesterase